MSTQKKRRDGGGEAPPRPVKPPKLPAPPPAKAKLTPPQKGRVHRAKSRA